VTVCLPESIRGDYTFGASKELVSPVKPMVSRSEFWAKKKSTRDAAAGLPIFRAAR